MFLIIADAHTKWLDSHVMYSSTAPSTIEKLQRIFSTMGLPETVVTVNGLAFTSHRFAEFMIEQMASTIFKPYHITHHQMEWQSSLCKHLKWLWGGWQEALLNQELHTSYVSIVQHHILQLVYLQLSWCLIDIYEHIGICCSQILVRLLDRTRIKRRCIMILMQGCSISRRG